MRSNYTPFITEAIPDITPVYDAHGILDEQTVIKNLKVILDKLHRTIDGVSNEHELRQNIAKELVRKINKFTYTRYDNKEDISNILATKIAILDSAIKNPLFAWRPQHLPSIFENILKSDSQHILIKFRSALENVLERVNDAFVNGWNNPVPGF